MIFILKETIEKFYEITTINNCILSFYFLRKKINLGINVGFMLLWWLQWEGWIALNLALGEAVFASKYCKY